MGTKRYFIDLSFHFPVCFLFVNDVTHLFLFNGPYFLLTAGRHLEDQRSLRPWGRAGAPRMLDGEQSFCLGRGGGNDRKGEGGEDGTSAGGGGGGWGGGRLLLQESSGCHVQLCLLTGFHKALSSVSVLPLSGLNW